MNHIEQSPEEVFNTSYGLERKLILWGMKYVQVGIVPTYNDCKEQMKAANSGLTNKRHESQCVSRASKLLEHASRVLADYEQYKDYYEKETNWKLTLVPYDSRYINGTDARGLPFLELKWNSDKPCPYDQTCFSSRFGERDIRWHKDRFQKHNCEFDIAA